MTIQNLNSAGSSADSAPGRAARIGIAALVLGGFGLYLVGLLLAWRGIGQVLPDQFTLELLRHAVTLKHLHQKIADDGVLLFLMVPLVLAIEAASVGWDRCSARRILLARTPTIKMDIACLLAGQTQIMSLIGRVLTFGLAVGIGMVINHALSAVLGLTVGVRGLPEPVQVFLYFWVYTFFDYWTHRLDHTRYFWPLHRFHHSTEDFCVITSLRTHPAAFSGLFIINLPMAVLGASVSVMITVNLIVTIIGLLIHSSLDTNWGWFGRWVIQSPNHHRLHHILDMTNPVGHFSMAPIWDHLFGSWVGEADQSLVIGVDTPYRHGYLFVVDLLRDYADFWRGLAGGLIKPAPGR